MMEKNLIVIQKDKIQKLIDELPVTDRARFNNLLSQSSSAETVLQEAFDAGREDNATLEDFKYQNYNDYINTLK